MSWTTSESLKKFFDPEKGEMRDVLIRAGAGAGKTTELVRRVISLSIVSRQKENRWPRLVVTTFTRKATQELRERLLHAGMQIQNEGLLQFLQNSQSLHISTIHGVLTIFLKKFGAEIGLSPDFQILNSLQEKRMRRKCLRQMMKESPQVVEDLELLLEEFDLSRLEQAMQTLWSLKSEEIDCPRVEKAEFEVEWQNQERFILEQTWEILDLLKDCQLNDSWTSWQAHLQGLLNANLSFRERLMAFQNASKPQARKSKEIDVEIVEKVKSLREQIENLNSYAYQPEFWERHEELSARFERLAHVWEEKVRREKIQNSKISMEDLELLSLRLIREVPETARHFSQEWDYWLIDEYQDTSPRQVQLMNAFTQGKKSFVVGDPQQSIYLFRGARREVFQQAEALVHERGGHVLELMTNYRTSKNTLNFMNELFVSVSAQFAEMQAGRDVHPQAHVDLWHVPEEKKSEGKQVEAALQRVQELLSQGVPPEDICLLGRKKKELLALVRRGLELGIPCQMHASGAYFDRREILDALFFLKFLLTPDDNVNLVGLLRSPWFPISDQGILKICHSGDSSYWKSLVRLSHDSEFSQTVSVLDRALERSKSEGISRVWRDLLIERGMFDYAQKLDPTGRREANLWKLVQNLFEQEAKPGFRYGDFLELPEVSSLEDSGQGDASPVVEPKRVQLMTIHASKGLQFPHVIVPFLNDPPPKRRTADFAWNELKKKWGLRLLNPETIEGACPWICEEAFDLQKEREHEELDRLFYVALTRSQVSLSLIWGKQVKGAWAERLMVFEETKGPDLNFRNCEPQAIRVQQASGVTKKVRKPWMDSEHQGHLRQALSISEVLAEDEKQKNMKSPTGSWEKVKRSIRGAEIHQFLEGLKYDSKSQLKGSDQEEILSFLSKGKGSFVQDLIRRGEVEWGFSVQIENCLVHGQIDLWGRDDKGQIWIVDYKTGSPDQVDRALLQLEFYAWALRRMGKVSMTESIRLAAVFPLHGEVIAREAEKSEQTEVLLKERLRKRLELAHARLT